MHVAHIAPEMTPFVKVGGLGDVVGSLPAAQVRDGHQATVVLPAYARIGERHAVPPAAREVSYRVDGQEVTGGVHVLQHDGVQVLLISQAQLFARPEIYGSSQDNGVRFGWFCGAALQALRETLPAPDVVVAHDWPAALVPVFLRVHARPDDPLEHAASVMVIHNLAHQGIFPLDLAYRLSLPGLALDSDGLEALGKINLLKGGIRMATIVLTVSPTYAKEIVWPQHGEGLEGELLARGASLTGIVNGLDTRIWDPQHDPALPAPYSAEDLGGKRTAKAALQAALGLRQREDLPLLGVVSRVDTQKGIDLIAQSGSWLVDQEAQLVVLGTGDSRLLAPLHALSARWKESVAVLETFDEGLAHRIYAGADFFVMPSRFEPCGLSQLVALRYGTVPIVHRTGGLADTIRDPAEHGDQGNGFMFDHADGEGLRWAAWRALQLFRHDRAAVDRMRVRGMREDVSWDHSAKAYARLLELATLSERHRVLEL